MREHCKDPVQIETLRREIARLERAPARSGDGPILSGCGPLDRLLPEVGFRRATLAEWLSASPGSGATTLALGAARRACRDGGTLIVLDRSGEFYPPAALRLGIEPEGLIVVRTDSQADADWALDQALRCRGVAAVLAWPERLDGRTFRRLQLAAEEGGGLGLLIRPLVARGEPSWADVRLLVEPLPAVSLLSHKRRLRVHLLRCRGGTAGRSIDLEIDDETCSVHLAAQLARPAAYADAAGA